jgi:hypothetical protein
MVYTIDLKWKEFKVDLASFALWLASNIPQYAGMSANSVCQIHCSTEPSEDDKLALEQYWNALTEAGENAKIEAREKIERAVKFAESNLPYKTMSTWAPAEIKLFMKQPLSLQDKADLLAIYPNV